MSLKSKTNENSRHGNLKNYICFRQKGMKRSTRNYKYKFDWKGLLAPITAEICNWSELIKNRLTGSQIATELSVETFMVNHDFLFHKH
jgi:hypothetical protein